MDLAYLIPALPLAGFTLLVLFGRRLAEPAAGWLATVAIGSSFAITVATWLQLLSRDAEHRSVTLDLFTWLPVGDLHLKASLLIDPLSITMALFVTGVGTLIHLYSVGYMHGDPRYYRFFLYLNLFAFSMLMLVLGDSFVLMFLGWEGVGACSYLLISFWFERESAAVAGKKAFVTNRVGDFGFMLAMFLVFSSLGTLTFTEVFARAGSLGRGTAAAVVLLLFVGACGKSAQLPLYVWLPDAMEGPTPVSALIHAATMVTAGVYLMARVNPLLHVAPESVATTIAIVGVATALFAATVACAQDDIKRVLAYSTISQLGFMFLAIGSGAYVAAVFHMVTHAFFKALLFLGAGSVIHGLHHEQDMKRMGGLRKLMPITAATFIVGWLAIAGVPPFSGFWSKDEILLAAYDKSPALWAVGLATALMTAYYMSRQVYLVFYGRSRWSDAPGSEHAPAAGDQVGGDVEQAPEAQPVSAGHGSGQPHESPWVMTLPLVVLAALAATAGLLNLPFGTRWHVLASFLEPVFGEHESAASSTTKVALAAAATGLALVGMVAARVWLRRPDRPALEPRMLREAWGVNGLFSFVFGTGGRLVAATSAMIDTRVVDGAVNGAGSVVRATGGQVRRLQTGYVRNYALGIAIGSVLVLGWVVLRAGA